MAAIPTSFQMAASVATADGKLAPGGTCELCLEALRHDPTNSAAYDYLAMMADEADPIVYLAQVAALAAAEETREGMQARLPPLWPRVLHLLADLKLPPDSMPGALIQLPVVLRAVRSSNEHLQTGGSGALARFTEDRTRAGEVPLEAITWLGRVLWCSESLPLVTRAMTVIGHLANLSSFVASLLHAAPPVEPRLVAFVTSEDTKLAGSAISALAFLTFCDPEAHNELIELGVLVAAESYLENTTADPSSKSIGMAALCVRALSDRASSARAAYVVRLLTRRLAALDGNISPEGNRTATALFASICRVLSHRVRDDDAAMLEGVLQREVLPVAQLFSRNDELAWHAISLIQWCTKPS
jgi:hypothetical protein